MNEKNLSKQEERALLELECQLARLKIQTSRQRKNHIAHTNTPSNSPNLMNVAQIANDVTQNNPLWKMAMLYGRGKQKLWLGGALLLWQILSNKQK